MLTFRSTSPETAPVSMLDRFLHDTSSWTDRLLQISSVSNSVQEDVLEGQQLKNEAIYSTASRTADCGYAPYIDLA